MTDCLAEAHTELTSAKESDHGLGSLDVNGVRFASTDDIFDAAHNPEATDTIRRGTDPAITDAVANLKATPWDDRAAAQQELVDAGSTVDKDGYTHITGGRELTSDDHFVSSDDEKLVADAWNDLNFQKSLGFKEFGDELYPTDKEQSIVKKYTGTNWYKTTNDQLRSGDAMTGARQAGVKTLDGLLQRSSLSDSVTVQRAFANDDIAAMARNGSITGKTFTDNGYMSTSITHGTWSDDIIMHLRVPEGTHALPITEMSHWNSEKELLIDRGSSFKITDVAVHPELKQSIELWADLVPTSGTL